MAEIVPEGEYLAKCSDIAATTSPEKGTDQVEAIFTIDEPGNAFNGRNLGWRGFFSEKTIDKTFESLENMGMASPAAKHMNTLYSLSGNGTTVKVVVEHEVGKDKDGNPKTFAKVRWVNGVGGAKIKAEKKVVGKDFDAFARKIAAMAGTTAAPASKTPTSEPSKTPTPKSPPKQQVATDAKTGAPQVADDDIPFAWMVTAGIAASLFAKAMAIGFLA